MHKLPRSLKLWLPVSLMALSGCATAPTYVPVTCPHLPPVPVPLMQPPPKPLQTASKLQSLLFEQATKPTPVNASSAHK